MINSYKEARAALSEPAQMVYDALQAIYQTDLDPSNLALAANSIGSGLASAANLEADFLDVKREENGISDYGTLVQKALGPLKSSPLKDELATQDGKTLEEIGHSLGIGATVLSSDSYEKVVAAQKDVSSLANLDDYDGLVHTLENLIGTYNQKAREYGEMVRKGMDKREQLESTLREQEAEHQTTLGEKDAYAEQLRSTVKTLKGEKGDLEQSLTDEKSAYQRLTAQKKGLEKELAQTEKEYESLQRENGNKDKTIEQLTERLGKYEAETGKSSGIGFAGKYLAAQRRVKQLEKEIDGYIADQDVDVDALTAKKDELAKRVGELEASLKQYKQGTQLVRRESKKSLPGWFVDHAPTALLTASLVLATGAGISLCLDGTSLKDDVSPDTSTQCQDVGIPPNLVVYSTMDRNFTVPQLIEDRDLGWERYEDLQKSSSEFEGTVKSNLTGKNGLDSLNSFLSENGYTAVVSKETCDAKVQEAKAAKICPTETKIIKPKIPTHKFERVCNQFVDGEISAKRAVKKLQ